MMFTGTRYLKIGHMFSFPGISEATNNQHFYFEFFDRKSLNAFSFTGNLFNYNLAFQIISGALFFIPIYLASANK